MEKNQFFLQNIRAQVIHYGLEGEQKDEGKFLTGLYSSIWSGLLRGKTKLRSKREEMIHLEEMAPLECSHCP